MSESAIFFPGNEGLEGEISIIQKILIQLFQELHYRIHMKLKKPRFRTALLLLISAILLKAAFFSIKEYSQSRKILSLKRKNRKLLLLNSLLRRKLAQSR